MILTKFISENKQQIENKFCMAKNVLEYDEKYKKVIFFVFGNALITENVKDGKYLKYNLGYAKEKAVTQSGVLFHKTAAITGGFIELKFEKEDFNELLKKKEEILRKLNELSAKKK